MESVINGGRGLSGFFWNSIIDFKIIFRLTEGRPSPIASTFLWKECLDTVVQKIPRLKFLVSNYELVASCLFAVSKKEETEIRVKANCGRGKSGWS